MSSSTTNTSGSLGTLVPTGALQSGASGEPFNVGIIIAIVLGGVFLIIGLIWLAVRQRRRWAEHENTEQDAQQQEKTGSLPAYADVAALHRAGSGSSDKRLKTKPLFLPGRRKETDHLALMERGQLPYPGKSYAQAPRRLQAYDGAFR